MHLPRKVKLLGWPTSANLKDDLTRSYHDDDQAARRVHRLPTGVHCVLSIDSIHLRFNRVAIDQVLFSTRKRVTDFIITTKFSKKLWYAFSLKEYLSML